MLLLTVAVGIGGPRLVKEGWSLETAAAGEAVIEPIVLVTRPRW